MLLTRDQILAADDARFEIVEVPEWKGKVRVRMMTGRDRDAYESNLILNRTGDKETNLGNIRATLLAFTIVDDEGTRVFSKEDIEALGEKSIKPIIRVFDVATKLNALRDEDVDALAGNSKTGLPDDSASG